MWLVSIGKRCFLLLLSILKSLIPKYLDHPSTLKVDTIPAETLQFLAGGKSSVVYAIDHKRVLKVFHETERSRFEYRVYRRLGSHPHIAKLLGTQEDGSIILERGQTLRTISQSPFAHEIPTRDKIQWLENAARGHSHAHNCNIVHADVGCGNMILTEEGVKIIDFEGCSIDDGPADSCYNWFSYRPSKPRVSRHTDIFAFACAIYEVMSGRVPYKELETAREPHRQVERLYEKNHFPDVTYLPLGPLIQRCWNGEVDSMCEIIQELQAFL